MNNTTILTILTMCSGRVTWWVKGCKQNPVSGSNPTRWVQGLGIQPRNKDRSDLRVKYVRMQ